MPWRREWQPTPVFLPGESHGWRSLAGYSAWSPKELDTAERLTLSLFISKKADFKAFTFKHDDFQLSRASHGQDQRQWYREAMARVESKEKKCEQAKPRVVSLASS